MLFRSRFAELAYISSSSVQDEVNYSDYESITVTTEKISQLQVNHEEISEISESRPPIIEKRTRGRSRERNVPTPDMPPMPMPSMTSLSSSASSGSISEAGGESRTRGVMERAGPQYNFSIVYPDSSRRRGEAGIVLVGAVIDAHGRCLSASVEGTSGYPNLDSAAVNAVLTASFRPARINGVNTQTQELFQIVFQLN